MAPILISDTPRLLPEKLLIRIFPNISQTKQGSSYFDHFKNKKYQYFVRSIVKKGLYKMRRESGRPDSL